MPLSASSQARLAKAHPVLRKLFAAVALETNIAVLDSQRGRVAQEKAFALGNSKAHFGQSAHNWSPSVAVDVVPYPIDWNNLQRFRDLNVVVRRVAAKQGVADNITWGGSWKFQDMPHYELSDWKQLVAAKKVKPYAG